MNKITSSDAVRTAVERLGRVPAVRRLIDAVLATYRIQAGTKEITADWKATEAFNAYEHGGIFINRSDLPEGQVPESDLDDFIDGIVESLRTDAFLEDRVANVHRREEVFSGPQTERLPEIIIEFADGYLGSSGYRKQRSRDSVQLREEGKVIGFHTMEGVLLADGPDVASTTVTGASLLDLAPTVHHFFDVPIPKSYDGTVLRDVFVPGSDVSERDASYVDGVPQTSERSLEDANLEGVEDRLQEMGYL